MKMLEHHSREGDELDEEEKMPLNKAKRSLPGKQSVLNKPHSLQATKPLQGSAGTTTPMGIPVYTEPEFVVDNSVVKLIAKMDIIPQWFLLRELESYSTKQSPSKVPKSKSNSDG